MKSYQWSVIGGILILVTIFLTRQSEEFPKTFPRFVTEDSVGKVITEKIFFGKLTAVLLWTDDEPCLKVLAGLDEVVKELPPGFQIIGLIGKPDIDAKKFSSIPQLKLNDNFAPLLTKVKFVPAVIFVDTDGKLLTPPILVTDAKFLLRELIRLSEKDSPQVKALNSLQKTFW